jgi:hypothetical protein
MTRSIGADLSSDAFDWIRRHSDGQPLVQLPGAAVVMLKWRTTTSQAHGGVKAGMP